MKKWRFESVVLGFSGSKNLLELFHIKNVDEISFLCSLGGALGGTGRFGFGQEFELVQIQKSETAFSATSASNIPIRP